MDTPLMGYYKIHGPMAPNMVTQHLDRLRTSICFDDSIDTERVLT
jgi:hypothetical protein